MKTGAIIQARMSSTRLPGKVLLPLAGKPALLHTIERLQQSEHIDEIIVATSENKNDDVLEKFCLENKIPVYRGSEDDVLLRYYECAGLFTLDTVVRITGDCPVIDPDIVDRSIEKLKSGRFDYINNIGDKRTFIHGLDTEVFTFAALDKAHNECENKLEREHVTLFIRNNPRFFKLGYISAEKDYCRPDIRATLDTEEDYMFLRAIFDELYPQNNIFKTKDIIELLNKKPYLRYINKNIIQKKQFFGVDADFKYVMEGVRILLLQDLDMPAKILLSSLNKRPEIPGIAALLKKGHKKKAIEEIEKIFAGQ